LDFSSEEINTTSMLMTTIIKQLANEYSIVSVSVFTCVEPFTA